MVRADRTPLSRRAVLAGAAAGASLALPGCSQSFAPVDGVYTIRMADGFPLSHQMTELIILPFIEKAERRSQGRLRFEHFPSEQLGKLRDLLRLTQWGMTEMAFIAPAFSPEKLPVSSVQDLPGALGQDIGEGVQVMEALNSEGSVLWETELAPQGIRPIAYISAPPSQLELSTSRRIERLSDLAGLKLRIASPATEELVKALDAVPIRMATGELIEALIRGTVDGAMLASGSVHAYDLGSQFTQMTTDLNFGTIAGTYAIREEAWNALPPDLRQIIADAGMEASREGLKTVQERDSRFMQEILDQGVRPIEFPPEDRADMQRRVDLVYRSWAAQMEAIGRPGNAALRELARIKAQTGIA